MKSFLIIVLISSLLGYLQADELQVQNHPAYLSLRSDDNNENGNLPTVSDFVSNFMTLLGLSADQTNEHAEPIFYSSQPLTIPASIWFFHVQGLDRLFDKGISLVNDGPFDIESVQSKLNADNAISVEAITISSESDINNLQDTLKNVLSHVKAETTLKYVMIICGACEQDQSIKQLKDQLTSVISQIVAGDSQTLAMVLSTTESAHVRQSRQLSTSANNITIAPMYSDEYPVMFNLFFWTSLVLGIIIIAIVYVFLTLDPGADTIIYRMTAPRLKAD